jgi:hypothetical protein
MFTNVFLKPLPSDIDKNQTDFHYLKSVHIMKFWPNNWLAVCMLIALAGCHSKKTVENESGDLETDGMEQAMQQQFKMLHDPNLNTIPAERLETAKQQARSLIASARLTALSWTERGPNNIGGRTRSMMVDRRDATGNTVFAGSVSGGIFKTTNFLSATPTWSPIDDKLANLAINALVQDRNTPNTMYAGTGEGWFNLDAVRGAGIFKSTDGGTTWTQLVSTIGFEYVQDLMIDNNGNLYASLRNASTLNRGVQRSTNGGTTWTQVLGLPLAGFTTGRAADLEVATNGDLYATLGIFSRTMVMKSNFSVNGANTGAAGTWAEITPVKTAVTQRAEIAVAPSNSQRLYLMMQDSATSEVKSLYRSSDGGSTWDSLAPPAPVNNGTVSQAWFNLIAAVDPNNPDVLVVGGYHLAKSTDAGLNFTDVTGTNHVDQHVLIYTSSSTLLVGNDGGVYVSTNANAATPTFVNKNQGYNATQFYGADYHPTNSNYFLAGAQDNNTQKFTAAGINTTVAVVGGDGGIPHIDQTDGQIQIAATTGNNFYRSLDGGNVWSFMSAVSNNRGQFINGTDYDDNLNVLYSGDDPGRYYYITNLQGTPSSNFNTLPQISSGREVTAVKVDPFSAGTVWLGTNSVSAGVIPAVLKVTSANTAAPNVVVSSILPSSIPAGSYISCIDVDPVNGNHILVTLSNFGITSVLESTDGGSSWVSIEGNLPDLPVYWGIFAPANAQLNGPGGGNGGILLGTELGVWTTSQINGTSTNWIPNSTGFPNVRTDMLKFRASDNMLVAATHGRGLFTTTLPTVILGVPTVDNTKNFIKTSFVSGSQLYIRTGNLAVTGMHVRLFDLQGQLLYSSDTKYNDQTVPVGNLPASSYILKVYGNKGEQYTRQFVK